MSGWAWIDDYYGWGEGFSRSIKTEQSWIHKFFFPCTSLFLEFYMEIRSYKSLEKYSGRK